MRHYGQAITPIDHNPYVGVDSCGKLHIHVNEKCYTDTELADRMRKLEVALAGVGLATPYPSLTADLIYEWRTACSNRQEEY